MTELHEDAYGRKCKKPIECPTCYGYGTQWDETCLTCGGQGTICAEDESETS